MLGQSIADLQTPPKRFMQRMWGVADIHTRQKWHILWPSLRQLPPNIRLLDAGCGTGRWTLELAKRFPTWTLTGIDLNERAITTARDDAARLNLHNVQFEVADFLEYRASQPYDVVLSVLSAHYLTQLEQQVALFANFRAWLRVGGRLILLAPRCEAETSFVGWLPQPEWHDVFSVQQLQHLMSASQLATLNIAAHIGTSGAIAKQVELFSNRLGLVGRLSYPVQVLLDVADRHTLSTDDKSVLLSLIADAI